MNMKEFFKKKYIYLLIGIIIIIIIFIVNPKGINWSGLNESGEMTGGFIPDFFTTLPYVLLYSFIWLIIWGFTFYGISFIISKYKK